MIRLYKEYAIGVKKLSEADLGWESSSSSQTHIGLSEQVFRFLPNTPEQRDGILIYNRSCSAVECAFSKIGKKRSTKVDSTTSTPVKSVVRQIRNIASDINLEWYLVWFALDNQVPVFWLINSLSEDFTAMQSIVPLDFQMKIFKCSMDEYFKILTLIRSITKLETLISQKFENSEDNLLIAVSNEHRTFVHLVLDYFRAKGELDVLYQYFSTVENDSPIKVFKEGKFNLLNMFMFSSIEEIKKRNSTKQGRRWYSDIFSIKNRDCYLYVDWYPGKNKNGGEEQLMIPDFVNLIHECYGNKYAYRNSQGTHELWLVNSPDVFNNNSSNSEEKNMEDRKEQFRQFCMLDLAESLANYYCIRLVTNPVIQYALSTISDAEDLYHEDREEIATQVLAKVIAYNSDMRDNGDFINDLSDKDIKDAPSILKKYCDFLEYIRTGVIPSEEDSNIEQIPVVLSSIISAIKRTGLLYEDKLIQRYACSLMTKPFVILSGLAGSGKTQLALAFARAMSENVEQQLCVVPVGADWTNREPLLGYPNALKQGEYMQPESGALQIMMRALRNPQKPYFLVLDEMNLSYVERYFADFLSALESNQKIPLWEKPDECDSEVDASIALPKNLFIVGTINVDETTYMFSPKVLDRANVIEFKISDKEMEQFLSQDMNINVQAADGACANMGQDFVQKATSKETDNSEFAQRTLLEFFKVLKKVNAEFGYRSATEIYRFIANAKASAPNMTEDEILDAAIVQKLLPKLHGSRKKLEPALKALWGLCMTDDHKTEAITRENAEQYAKFAEAADKIQRMMQTALDNGFTSFAEA